MKILLDREQLERTILRLSHQLTENDRELKDTVFIGIQPRGVKFSDKVVARVGDLCGNSFLRYGKLDITFYRDDIRDELHVPKPTELDFSVEGKRVVLMDDVLYTGRTIRAALDAIQDFGRPSKIELCVLIDRRFNRELPIQPDYCGKSIDALMDQEVKVCWDKETVKLF